MSRTTLAMNVLRHYEKARESKNAPVAKALGSEELAKKFAEAQGKLTKKWWATVSSEERRERAKRAAEARWGNKEQEPPTE
jgi:hypothetical protein